MSITLHLSDEPELPASAPAPEPRAPRGHGKHQMSADLLRALQTAPISGRLVRGESWQSARHYTTGAPTGDKRQNTADRR